MSSPIRKATAQSVVVGPFLSVTDGVSAVTTLTGSSTLNGEAVTNGTGAAYTPANGAAVAHIANGFYKVVLATGDVPTAGLFTLSFYDPTTFGSAWKDFEVLEPAVYDVLFGTTAPSTFASLGGTAPAGWINTAAFASGATIPRVTLADTLTTYTGNTPQTGDAYARLGAPAGASVSADVAAVEANAAAAATSVGTGLKTELDAVKAKTDNLPSAFPTNFATLAITASTGLVSVNLAQTGLAPRALDAVADASLTLGDALVAAVCEMAGQEAVSGTSYVKKTPGTGTTVRTFTLDSASTPTTRT